MDIKKLSYESKASQEGWEMWKMLEKVSELEPKVIVEIGCDKGGFLDTLKEVFPGARVIGVDTVRHENLTRHEMIYGDSADMSTATELIGKLAGGRIDFLFIDGDHHYQAVKSDYDMYSIMVRKGGIIGFHDVNSRDIDGVEVGSFIHDLRLTTRTLVQTFQLNESSPGTSIIWM